MKLKEKTKEKISFTTDMSTSLANAIRRSIGQIPVVAVDEIDVYKNDSALYDEIIAHRLGLVPLKNQKLKADQSIELKMKAKGKGEKTQVLAGALGDQVVYPDMPLVLLEEGQELELVARAKIGIGQEHAKFSPGMMYYKHLPKIKLSAQGEKQSELAELYPQVFSFDGKLKVVDESKCDLDAEDVASYPGVELSFDDQLVCTIESWGQMDAKDIFLESCKALKANLSAVSKAVK